MSAIPAYFALAGVLPFTIVLGGVVRTALRRPRPNERRGVAGVAVTVAVLFALAAIDSGFVALAVRATALALHAPG